MGLPIKQPPFQNVGVGQTAIIPRLDMGDTCDALILKMSGTIDDAPTNFDYTDLDAIRLKLGGKTVVDGLSGAEIYTINSFMDRGVSATYLAIRFADDVARTITGENMGGIDTSVGYSSFSLEVDIGVGDGGGGGAPALECWMEKSRPKPEGATKLLFRAYLRGTDYFGSAAVHNLTPPFGSQAGNILARCHIFTPNDRISRIDVKKNGVEIQGDGEKALMDFVQGLKR
ncbi:MAG: hypothetical protein CMQ38_08040, partial [Gammaproteobacteria bacterium]|nr:hypothetical protein [Gammaproteobacteria bacterium]